MTHRKWCSNADSLYFGNAGVQARVPCLMHVGSGVSVFDFLSKTLRAITTIVSTALFLLLLSGSAEAQSVGDSGGGPGVACDIGPNAPAIPAEAQAAGFTHCAANWDFSQPLYATLSNWFDCDGGNPNVLWHSGSAGVFFSPPCNSRSIHQINDNGPTVVMQFKWRHT